MDRAYSKCGLGGLGTASGGGVGIRPLLGTITIRGSRHQEQYMCVHFFSFSFRIFGLQNV